MNNTLKIPIRFPISSLLNKLEFVVLVFMLVYFLGAVLPPPIAKLMNVSSYGVVGLLVLLNFNRVVQVASHNVMLWILLTLVATSILWSVNPSVSIDNARGLSRTSLLGIYIAARYSFSQQIKLWLFVFGLATILSLVVGIVQGQVMPWIGVFPQKNYLARVMALSANLFLLASFIDKERRWLCMFFFMLAFAVLLLSQGKLSLILFATMVMLLPFIVSLKINYKLQIPLYLLILLVTGIAATILLSNIEFILVDVLGKNLELNGRVPVWKLCLDKIQERPLLGYGYAAFWESPESLYVTNNTWASVGYLQGTSFNPHHGFIGIALSIGWSGVILVVLSLVSTLSKVVHVLISTKRLEYLWMLQFLVFLLVFNLVDNAGLLTGKDALWTLYISIASSASITLNQNRQDNPIVRGFPS